MVEHDQRIHLASIQDDPVKMWIKLEEIHMAKRAGARFNAYDDLFSIRKKEEESLMSLTNRIDTAMHTIQNLRPTDFTLAKLDDELLSMAMICSLPTEYSNFVSSLLLMDKLDKSTVQQAFHTEETQRRHRSEIEDQGPSDKALNTMSKNIKDLICAFCNKPGHNQEKCFKYKRAMENARKPRPPRKKGGAKVATEQPDLSYVEETAGKVSLQTPHTSQSLNNWNPDTGATNI